MGPIYDIHIDTSTIPSSWARVWCIWVKNLTPIILLQTLTVWVFWYSNLDKALSLWPISFDNWSNDCILRCLTKPLPKNRNSQVVVPVGFLCWYLNTFLISNKRKCFKLFWDKECAIFRIILNYFINDFTVINEFINTLFCCIL